MYQYTDATGVVHFTDVKPGEDVKDVKSSAVRMDAEPLVRAREEGQDAFRTWCSSIRAAARSRWK